MKLSLEEIHRLLHVCMALIATLAGWRILARTRIVPVHVQILGNTWDVKVSGNKTRIVGVAFLLLGCSVFTSALFPSLSGGCFFIGWLIMMIGFCAAMVLQLLHNILNRLFCRR